MKKKHKINLKIGDTVRIISGFSKNKVSEITRINNRNNTLTLKGINYKFKHVKPQTKISIGERKKFEFPIHRSNVNLNLKDIN